MARTSNFEVRRAGLEDVDEIAAAHLDSIRSIGPRFYPPEIVNDWGARPKGDLYANAMAQGEKFFIAIGNLDGKRQVLGFASHRIDKNEHRTAVYVRGGATRLGIGSALFRSAEASAIAAGAHSIHLDASLAAIEFYRRNGFEETGRGEHRLWSGRPMECVFMRKNLAEDGSMTPIERLTEQPVARYADVNGLRMYYEVVGAGRPVVLLHGGSCTIDYCFGHITAPLAATRTVIAVEQQGHGHTADVDRPLSYRQMADDTAALLESIGTATVDFIGWSDGGNVALQIAIRHPHLVRRIVVTGANYSNAGLDAEAHNWLESATPETWPSAIRESYERAAPDPQHFPVFFAKLKKMWLEFEDWPPRDLQSVAAPVLVMIGDKDIVRPEHAVEMSRLIPNAQLAILPGTGHRTLIERPEWFLSMALAFLDAPEPDSTPKT